MAGRPGVNWERHSRSRGCFRSCQSEKVSDPLSIPKSGLPCLQPGSPSFQRRSRGGEKSRSRASPGLPSPAWPRAWNPAPLQPRLGETARQGATCQKTLGEQEGRTGAFCTLRLLISSSVDTPPGSPLPRHYTHTHAFALPTIPGPSIKTLVEFFLIKKKKKKCNNSSQESPEQRKSVCGRLFIVS